MPILTAAMKRLVEIQRLCYVASVCADGTPNLSPRGTIAVWNDDQLVFADIRSPGTTTNILENPSVEVNVVDPIVRKGFRFKGNATVVGAGPEFDEIVAFFRKRGVRRPIRHVVLVQVERALPLVSPAYDLGASEAEVRAQWERYWSTIQAGDAPEPTGE